MYGFNQKMHKRLCDKPEQFFITLLARRAQQMAKRVIVVAEETICKLGILNERNHTPQTDGATTKILTGRSTT